MGVRLVSACLAVAFAGGCTALPEFRHHGSVSSADIVRHVQCELQAAYVRLRETYPVLEKFAAAYKITFRAESQHTGGLAAGTWTVPGGVSIGATGSASSRRVRQGVVKYQTRFMDVQAFACPEVSEARSHDGAFKGDLGIAEWLDSALSPSHQVAAAQPAELTYLVNFVASYDSALRPTFAIVNLTGTPLLSGSRTDSDTLDLAFLDISQKAPPRPTEIRVVNWPPGLTTGAAPSVVTPTAAPARETAAPALPADVQQRLNELLDFGSSD